MADDEHPEFEAAQPAPSAARSEARWRTWGRSAFAVAVAISLISLATANVLARLRPHEIEDGALWAVRGHAVTAVDVASGTAAAAAGIRPGDVLAAIDGVPVTSARDVAGALTRRGASAIVSYRILRGGSPRDVALTLEAAQNSPFYYVLFGVGLFALLVGASVRLRRPRDQATLHFFWICVALFGVFAFSFDGPFNRLDWVFYWADVIAMAMLPPLVLHFTLVFPDRPGAAASNRNSVLVPMLYMPAVALGAARIVAISRAAQQPQLLSSSIDVLDRAELVYLAVCGLAAVAVLFRAFREIAAPTARRQLRWIAWGTALGVGPFAIGYALPWALGGDPPLALQLTVIPLGLVPLTFASAIVRYRLQDVEVIVKRGLVYVAFLAATVLLYGSLVRLTGFAFGDSDEHTRVVALLATLVVVLLAQPAKEAIQNALDRLFYRDRYDYRRALVGFARDLNSDLDVVRISQRLVTRVVETLVVDRMALMLADDRSGGFTAIDHYGFVPPVPSLPRTSSLMPRLDAGRTITLDDPLAAARFTAEEVEFWRDAGLSCFVPCMFEGSAIAVLALGRTAGDEPFNSEDLALLTAVAGQVATAIENGRLYREIQLKADELGRMREFNENILESLDDGLVVFDVEERIVRWNRALESVYGLSRRQVIGRALGEAFDADFIDALRAARDESPIGATLYRVPLTSRRDRTPLLVNATFVPLQSGTRDAPSVVGTILLLENVTERVQLEKQLQISEKMASIGLLAAGVAHEVNTPLTGISSFTQMLLDGADPADPKTVLLEKIERQTFRAAKIVNGLLNLSRPVSGTGERVDVDVNAVVTDVFSLLEHQFEVSRIKVRRDLGSGPMVVRGIEHQLQQVFLNLFLNARDAMPRGGWLSVTTRGDGDRIVAEVADTGSGIPAEQLSRIYDPFFTTKAIGRGTGLGLSITYGIVQEHDATIQCDSVVGQGTRFTLAFRAAAADTVRSASRAAN